MSGIQMKSYHKSENDKDQKSLVVALGILYNSNFVQPMFMNLTRN